MLGLQLVTWKYIPKIHLSEKKIETNEFRYYNF